MADKVNHLLLEVDLAKQKSRVRPLDEALLRDYIGGLGLGMKILYDEVGPDVDPLSPQNILFLSPGPLSGTDAPTSSRTEVVTKSPLTGIIGIGNFGGSWGARFRRAGFEALLVRNDAESPVYLWIDDGKVELKSAAHLWGKDAWQTTDALKNELGNDVSVLAIGQAGENLVKFACPTGDYDHSPGRSHAGCIMGQKKLKAVAVRGTRKIPIAEPENFKAAINEVIRRIDEYPEGKFENRRRVSSADKTTPFAKRGLLPCRNFQQTGLPPESDMWRAAEIAMANTTQQGPKYGHHCVMAEYYGCNLRTDVKKGIYAGLNLGGAGFSLQWRYFIGLCGINGCLEMYKCSELCQRYGMDMTNPLPFVFELYQRGIIDSDDLDGLQLDWGNGVAAIELLGKIAFREGLGDIFAEGSVRAAEKIGNGADKYVMTQKGLEIMYIDPRLAGWGMILGNTVGLRGGDDLTSTHVLPESVPGWTTQLGWDEKTYIQWFVDYIDMFPEVKAKIFGSPPGTDFFRKGETSGKAEWVIWLEKLHALFNSLGVCLMAAGCWLPMGPTHYAKLYSALTGRETTPRELMEIGDRIVNLMKCYNVREGLTRRDDTWPRRFFEEPVPDGPFKGSVLDKNQFNRLLDEYYRLRGWEKISSVPGKAKLMELGLQDAAHELENMGKYSVKNRLSFFIFS